MVKFGEYIPLLGADHMLYLGGFFLVLFLMVYYRDAIRQNRRRADLVLAAVIVFQQTVLYTSYAVFFDFTLGEALPLHICRLASLMILAWIATENRTCYVLAAVYGLFAFLSFVYPSRVYGVVHPIGWSFFLSHAVNLLFPLYAYIAGDETLKKEDIAFAYKVFLGYFVFVYFLNPLIDGNYFYLRYKPVVGDMSDLIYVPAVLILCRLLFEFGSRLYMHLLERLTELPRASGRFGDRTARLFESVLRFGK